MRAVALLVLSGRDLVLLLGGLVAGGVGGLGVEGLTLLDVVEGGAVLLLLQLLAVLGYKVGKRRVNFCDFCSLGYRWSC